MSNYRPCDKSYNGKATIRFIPYAYNKPIIVDKKLYIEPYYFTDRTGNSGGHSSGNPKYGRTVTLRSLKKLKCYRNEQKYNYKTGYYRYKKVHYKNDYKQFRYWTIKDVLLGKLELIGNNWFRVIHINYHGTYEKYTNINIENVRNPISGHDDRYLLNLTSNKRSWCGTWQQRNDKRM